MTRSGGMLLMLVLLMAAAAISAFGYEAHTLVVHLGHALDQVTAGQS